MWSWIILTDKGLRNIRLVDLKFHTQVKGWVCDASSHVYNFNTSGPFRSGSQITGFISNTICNSFASPLFIIASDLVTVAVPVTNAKPK